MMSACLANRRSGTPGTAASFSRRALSSVSTMIRLGFPPDTTSRSDCPAAAACDDPPVSIFGSRFANAVA